MNNRTKYLGILLLVWVSSSVSCDKTTSRHLPACQIDPRIWQPRLDELDCESRPLYPSNNRFHEQLEHLKSERDSDRGYIRGLQQQVSWMQTNNAQLQEDWRSAVEQLATIKATQALTTKKANDAIAAITKEKDAALGELTTIKEQFCTVADAKKRLSEKYTLLETEKKKILQERVDLAHLWTQTQMLQQAALNRTSQNYKKTDPASSTTMAHVTPTTGTNVVATTSACQATVNLQSEKKEGSPKTPTVAHRKSRRAAQRFKTTSSDNPNWRKHEKTGE